MLATLINAAAIIIGTVIGLAFGKLFKDRARDAVFNATGVLSLVIGLSMALKTGHVLAMAIALIAGGLAGTALDIEGAIERLGEALRRRFARKGAADDGGTFAYGFLNASVLFCVGAMALVGSFKAGVEGDYTLLLAKSVMDAFIAIIFAGTMGVGVGFSALSVLVYQGALTLLSVWVAPLVSQELITELSAVGGALVVMIGINLLGLKKIRTGDFLPALVVIVALAPLFKYIGVL